MRSVLTACRVRQIEMFRKMQSKNQRDFKARFRRNVLSQLQNEIHKAEKRGERRALVAGIVYDTDYRFEAIRRRGGPKFNDLRGVAREIYRFLKSIGLMPMVGWNHAADAVNNPGGYAIFVEW